MYRPNTLKQRIARGESVYGSWSVLGSPFATQVICEAGFDFIIVDHEHDIGDLPESGHGVRNGERLAKDLAPPLSMCVSRQRQC
jgi:4-hydroxy-2-oxoheptanedioate aldolase